MSKPAKSSNWTGFCFILYVSFLYIVLKSCYDVDFLWITDTHTQTHTHTYIYIYIYIYGERLSTVIIYMYVYTHTHTHTYIYIYIYIYIYNGLPNRFRRMRAQQLSLVLMLMSCTIFQTSLRYAYKSTDSTYRRVSRLTSWHDWLSFSLLSPFTLRY